MNTNNKKGGEGVMAFFDDAFKVWSDAQTGANAESIGGVTMESVKEACARIEGRLRKVNQTRATVAALIAERDALKGYERGWRDLVALLGLSAGLPGCSDAQFHASVVMPKLRELIADHGALAAEVKALREAASGLKFDVYKLTTPELRAGFGGVKEIAVVQMETVNPLREAITRASTATGDDGGVTESDLIGGES